MITQIANTTGGALGNLMNLVPTPGRLTILPISVDTSIPLPAGPPYVAQFNPDNWQSQNTLEYHSRRRPGNNGTENSFHLVTAPTLSFDLTIDGTGASGEKREVLADILLLKEAVLFNGVKHKPNLLLVIWGTQLFRGVLTSMNIRYTLFRPNGTPLRATVTLSFVEQRSASEILRLMNLGSADLTHRHLVKTNDRLDLICHYVYQDARYHIEVARANNLTSFRKLPAGAEIVLPPVEK